MVKATFALEHPDAPLTLAAPDDVVPRDRHRGDGPASSLVRSGELAPRCGRVNVTVAGHAHAPGGAVGAAVRFALYRGSTPRLDKTLHVHGDRVLGAGGVPSAPQPFTHLELAYERARRTDDNPHGRGDDLPPNLVDAADPLRPAGFGPLSPYARARAARLGATDRAALEHAIAVVPDAFDWRYFDAAPADQQLDALDGDEWLVLDGLRPDRPRLAARLPGAIAGAFLTTLDDAALLSLGAVEDDGWLPIALRCDTVHVDADALRVSLLWRGDVPLADEEAVDRLCLVGDVTVPPHALSRPDRDEVLAAVREQPPVSVAAPPMSFRGAAAAFAHPVAPAPAGPAPQRRGTGEVTLIDAQGRSATLHGDALARIDRLLAAPEAATSTQAITPELLAEVLRGGEAAPFAMPAPGRSAAPGSSAGTPFGPPSDRAPAASTLTITPEMLAEALGGGESAPFAMPAPGSVRGPGGSASPAASSREGTPFGPPSVRGPAPPSAPPPSVASPSVPPSVPAAPGSVSGTGVIDPAVLAAALGQAVRFAAPAGSRPRAGAMRPFREGLQGDVPLPHAAGTMDVGAVMAALRGEVRADVEEAREPPPGELVLPERRSLTVPFLNLSAMSPATLPWQHRPPRDSLVIVVKGSFEIVADGAARPLPESDPPCGDRHHDDDATASLRQGSELALFKPRADVTLAGHAHAPWSGQGRARQRSATASRVRLSFGHPGNRFERTVAVVGDRTWRRTALGGDAAGEPAAFERIPLRYERALGGPGYRDNPCGVGTSAAVSAGHTSMPNLEEPTQLLRSPADTPPPACFGPLRLDWAPRWSHIGRGYDARWLRERWPYFPDDFSWLLFQHAPRTQQLAYLAGDEPFEIAGAHPEHDVLRGRLPGIEPHCFLVARSDDRAVDALGAKLLLERVTLHLDTAHLDVDTMRLDLVWRGVLDVSDEHAPEIQALFLLSGPLGQAPTGEEAYARLVAHLAANAPVADTPAGESAVANDTTAQASAAAGDTPWAAARARALAAAPATEAPPPAIASLPAAVSSGEPQPSGRQRVQERLAAGASLEGLDLAEADLSDLDLGGQSLRGINLARARLVRAVLRGADLRGATLAGADLSGVDAVGSHLEGADLNGARLEGGCLDEALLDQADLGGVRAAGLRMERARGVRVRFAGGCLDRAVLTGAELPKADLSGCSLDDAVFDGAVLTGAALHDARGARVSFRQATLDDALCDDSVFPEVALVRASARGSVWERCDVRKGSFVEAVLVGASFAQALCDEADFSRADLADARLTRAALPRARLLEANLQAAQLERCDLSGADLRGACLFGTETHRASMRDTDLGGALLAGSKLAPRTP